MRNTSIVDDYFFINKKCLPINDMNCIVITAHHIHRKLPFTVRLPNQKVGLNRQQIPLYLRDPYATDNVPIDMNGILIGALELDDAINQHVPTFTKHETQWHTCCIIFP